MSSNEGYAEVSEMSDVAKKLTKVSNEPIVNDLLDNKEINAAALKFKNGLPVVKRMVDGMSKKGIHRVMKGLIEFPLGDAYPKFIDKQEQKLFNLTLELIDAKNLMIEAIVAEQRRLAELATPHPNEELKEKINE